MVSTSFLKAFKLCVGINSSVTVHRGAEVPQRDAVLHYLLKVSLCDIWDHRRPNIPLELLYKAAQTLPTWEGTRTLWPRSVPRRSFEGYKKLSRIFKSPDPDRGGFLPLLMWNNNSTLGVHVGHSDEQIAWGSRELRRICAGDDLSLRKYWMYVAFSRVGHPAYVLNFLLESSFVPVDTRVGVSSVYVDSWPSVINLDTLKHISEFRVTDARPPIVRRFLGDSEEFSIGGVVIFKSRLYDWVKDALIDIRLTWISQRPQFVRCGEAW